MATVLIVTVLMAAAVEPGPVVVGIAAEPSVVRLDGSTARHLVLVDGRTTSGRVVDLTGSARFRVLDRRVATVDDQGLIRPAGDGRTEVVVEAAGYAGAVDVTVVGADRPRRFN